MKDINRYDYLFVSVKTDSEEEMVARYKKFGWELTKRSDDKHFSDIAVINLRRPHAILNKDRLQYLQVGMETAVNDLSKYKQKKHAFSLALGITLGVFACAMLAGGIVLIVLSYLWSLIIGYSLAVLATMTLVVMPLVLKRIISKENLRYDIVVEKTRQELSLIEKEAAELIGDNNG